MPVVSGLARPTTQRGGCKLTIEAAVSAIRAEAVLGEFSYEVFYEPGSPHDRLKAIYAPNGWGKTNFLKAIALALNPSLEGLQGLVEIPFRHLAIEFASGASIEIVRSDPFAGSFTAIARAANEKSDDAPGVPEARIDIDIADFSARLYRRAWETRKDFQAFLETARSISCGAEMIGDDRLAPTLEELRDAARPDTPTLARRSRSAGAVGLLLQEVERVLNQNALATMSRERGGRGVYSDITRTTLKGSERLSTADARTALETKVRNLLVQGRDHEAYGLVNLRELRDIGSQIRQARQNARSLPTLHQILTPFLDDLEDQMEILTPSLEMINTYVTEVNRFLDRKQIAFSTSFGIRLTAPDGGEMTADSLSSGERHLLYLLSHAVLATRSQSLLILDEPEISLGLEWQRDILNALLKCSSAANVQFLIASHSVQVLSNIPDSEIVRPTEDG